MAPTEQYPIDFDALTPGDIIGPDRLESIVQAPKEYSVYAAKCQSIIERVMRERADLVAWFEDFGIKIGTPEESLDKVGRRNRRVVRKLRVTATMAMRIPIHELPPERQREAENLCMVSTARVAVVGGITAKRLATSDASEELPNAGATMRLIGKKPAKP